MNLLRPAALALLLAASTVPALPARAAPPDPPAPAAPTKAWEGRVEFTVAGRKMTLAEPMVIERNAAAATIRFRHAVQFTDSLGKTSYGMVELTGATHADLSSGLVLVDGLEVADCRFPQLLEQDREPVVTGLKEALPKEILLKLEVLLADPAAAAEPRDQGRVLRLAPEVLVRTRPAMLVQFDGEPVMLPVGDFPLEYAANTATDVFRDPKAGRWFMLAENRWLEAKDVAGPWTPLAGSLPVLMTQFPNGHPRSHVKRFVPGTPENAAAKPAAPKSDPPEVIVRKEPAELVLLAGDPLFTWIGSLKLMDVANTDSDLLFHPKSGNYLLLLAGRWYQSSEFTGPWRDATGSLPEDLAQIPRDHRRAHVLWSVPGTPEAREAIVRAQFEERAVLSKALRFEAQFEGNGPATTDIAGTGLAIVTNSDDDIVSAAGTWYACARGVWVESKDGKRWQPSLTVPETLKSLPETAGMWHVRFARPTGAAEGGEFGFAATAGYAGVYVLDGAVVHGNGATRRGTLRNANWYPCARTWGENRWYDPVLGVFHPRTVRYGADMKPLADEWSPYTASYGRVRHYADRYNQGGRRMFAWDDTAQWFDRKVSRPDGFGTWGESLKKREGLAPARFPLGDRSTDQTRAGDPPVLATDGGVAWRLGEKGPETWNGKAWGPAAGTDCPEPIRAWLTVWDRLHARPAQLRAWAARRAMPLPVNAVR